MTSTATTDVLTEEVRHAAMAGTLRAVPKIDDGSTEDGPGRPLKNAWVTLGIDEAQELLEALKVWAEDLAAGNLDPGWHTHLSDSAGNELTIAIGAGET